MSLVLNDAPPITKQNERLQWAIEDLLCERENSPQIFQQPVDNNLTLPFHHAALLMPFHSALMVPIGHSFFGSNDQDRPRIGCINYLALWSELTEVRFLRTDLHKKCLYSYNYCGRSVYRTSDSDFNLAVQWRWVPSTVCHSLQVSVNGRPTPDRNNTQAKC